MSKPSWFESTNNISEISEPSADAYALDPTMDIQKIRCLWLISFIQDMRTFMGFSSRFYIQGLSTCPALYKAALLLRDDFQAHHMDTSQDLGMTAPDYDRLTCVFAICLMIQDSMTTPLDGPLYDSLRSRGLVLLNGALAESQAMWEGSVQNLCPILHHHLTAFHVEGLEKVDYIKRMIEILGHLSLEARTGVEKCLLNMLCRTQGAQTTFLVDDGWTPDSLLSRMHGQ